MSGADPGKPVKPESPCYDIADDDDDDDDLQIIEVFENEEADAADGEDEQVEDEEEDEVEEEYPDPDEIPEVKVPVEELAASTISNKPTDPPPEVKRKKDSSKSPVTKVVDAEEIEAGASGSLPGSSKQHKVTIQARPQSNEPPVQCNNLNSRFLFCHRCHNLLTIDTNEKYPCHRLVCPTCPFYLNVTGRHTIATKEDFPSDEEEEDDLELAAKAEENRQRTSIICPQCSNKEAFFYQLQIRSADEPMTNFYECTNKECRYNWRD